MVLKGGENMWGYGFGGRGMMDVAGYGAGLGFVLWLITWFLIAIVLIALARWLWKKGNGK